MGHNLEEPKRGTKYDAVRSGKDCLFLPFDFSTKSNFYSNKVIIAEWGELNLQGIFFVGYFKHYFEFEEDKLLFILKWGA